MVNWDPASATTVRIDGDVTPDPNRPIGAPPPGSGKPIDPGPVLKVAAGVTSWRRRHKILTGIAAAIATVGFFASLAPHDRTPPTPVPLSTIQGTGPCVSGAQPIHAWLVNDSGYAPVYRVQCGPQPVAPCEQPSVQGPGTCDIYPPHEPANAQGDLYQQGP